MTKWNEVKCLHCGAKWFVHPSSVSEYCPNCEARGIDCKENSDECKAFEALHGEGEWDYVYPATIGGSL